MPVFSIHVPLFKQLNVLHPFLKKVKERKKKEKKEEKKKRRKEERKPRGSIFSQYFPVNPAQMHFENVSPADCAQNWLLLHPPSLIKHVGSHNVVIFQDAVMLSLFSRQIASAFRSGSGEKGETLSKTQ